MSDTILDAKDTPVAKIEQSGEVWMGGRKIGRVLNGGEVWNEERKVGHYRDGYVYEGESRIGRIEGNGRVFDKNDRYAGKTVGGHMYEGGAALLLLIL